MAISQGVYSGPRLTGVRGSGTHATAYVAPATAQPKLSVTSGAGGYGLTTSSPQQAGSYGSTVSPQGGAVNPFNYGSYTSTGISGTSGTGGTGAGGTGGADAYGGYGSAEAQAAAQAQAARVAQANAIKGSITGLIGNIKGVYDALYGDVNAVAADKTGQIDKQYGQDVKSLTDQFNNQFPLIGQGYGARGTYDSSYRINAEKSAQDQFGNSTATLAQGRDSDLAGVGQFLATQQADFKNQKSGLDAVLAQIQASENPDELTQLQNTLAERQRTLEASRANLGTRDSYLAQLNSAVPASARVGGLKDSLTNVLNSAVPAPIKLAIAGQLVNQSGLNGADTKKLLEDFTSQVNGGEDQKQPIA